VNSRNRILPLQPLLLVAWALLLALFFAQVEIQIEGSAGWAANLPTWRIERHWLLDLLWGGRPMTGYHAWVFPFMALCFHLPVFVLGAWSWRLESRILASLMIFWTVEDFLWFVLNPAYGIVKFDPGHIAWHKHWWHGAPVDYWVSAVAALLLLSLSYWRRRSRTGNPK
jgi:hypothetical protein